MGRSQNKACYAAVRMACNDVKCIPMVSIPAGADLYFVPHLAQLRRQSLSVSVATLIELSFKFVVIGYCMLNRLNWAERQRGLVVTSSQR